MQLSSLSWQDLARTHAFSAATVPVHFWDFQPNADQAIRQFIANPFGSALILKTETFPEFIAEIEHCLVTQQILTVTKTEFNRKSLFGYSVYLPEENKTETISGAIQQADNGVLILNLNALLLDITQWDKLKQALLFGYFEPHSANAIPHALSPIHTQFKLMLIGEREAISALANYDDSLYQFAQYAEIESHLELDDEHLDLWGNYVQTSAQKYLNKSFSPAALNQFYQNYIRESENQQLISISPTLLKKYLLGLNAFSPKNKKIDHVQAYFDYLEQQASVLHQYAVQDILNHQQYLETEGEAVGQINGLSVVEFEGLPYAFGEPLRISCNIQYGDGEITDIERKVELGGNIHAKGIVIAQSCLTHLLEFPTQLPFSAALAFEQSYGEIDGDSSSLAIFCVLMSALTKLPLPQSMAITGSIDQFGNVLSVGGVNQKIEGFFNICQARGLNGKQGVIIPATCVSHLSLKPAVVEAVKQGEFSVWAVNDVFEALSILLQHEFYDEEAPQATGKPSLFSLVHQAIEQGQEEETAGSILRKICKRFGIGR